MSDKTNRTIGAQQASEGYVQTRDKLGTSSTADAPRDVPLDDPGDLARIRSMILHARGEEGSVQPTIMMVDEFLTSGPRGRNDATTDERRQLTLHLTTAFGIVRDGVVDAILRDFTLRRPEAPPATHMAKSPFVPYCGADMANQHSADNPALVTCLPCLRIAADIANANRSDKATRGPLTDDDLREFASLIEAAGGEVRLIPHATRSWKCGACRTTNAPDRYKCGRCEKLRTAQDEAVGPDRSDRKMSAAALEAVLTFARETWRNDGAEGEAVHRLLGHIEDLRRKLKAADLELAMWKKEAKAATSSPETATRLISEVVREGSIEVDGVLGGVTLGNAIEAIRTAFLAAVHRGDPCPFCLARTSNVWPWCNHYEPCVLHRRERAKRQWCEVCDRWDGKHDGACDSPDAIVSLAREKAKGRPRPTAAEAMAHLEKCHEVMHGTKDSGGDRPAPEGDRRSGGPGRPRGGDAPDGAQDGPGEMERAGVTRADNASPSSLSRDELIAEVEVLRQAVARWDRKYRERRENAIKGKIARRAGHREKKRQWDVLAAMYRHAKERLPLVVESCISIMRDAAEAGEHPDKTEPRMRALLTATPTFDEELAALRTGAAEEPKR